MELFGTISNSVCCSLFMFHQILPKIDLAPKVDKFEKGVFGLVQNDQRQREVVVEFRKSKYGNFH